MSIPVLLRCCVMICGEGERATFRRIPTHWGIAVFCLCKTLYLQKNLFLNITDIQYTVYYFLPLFLALCFDRALAARFLADWGRDEGALRLGSWKDMTFLGLARSSISMGEPLKSKALRRVFFKKVR